MFFFFFFQAEDGIRDFCLSRGLGDVYKRQVITLPKKQTIDFLKVDLATGNLDLSNSTIKQADINLNVGAVSYTHLTLPTNREV